MTPPPSPPLFRHESIDFQRHRMQWGEVTLLQPVSHKFLIWLLIFTAFALMVFALCAHYSRKETVVGYLSPINGTARLHASQHGVVAKVHVRDGDAVEAGQALFSVETAQIAASGQDVNAAVMDALTSQQARLIQQIEAEAQRQHTERLRMESLIQGLLSEMAHLDAQMTTQRERIQIAQRNLTTGESLKLQGFVSDADNDRRRADLLEQKQALANLAQQQAGRHNQLTEQRYALEQLPAASAERVRILQDEVSGLAQRRAEVAGRGAYVIRSPISGRVSGLQATLGQTADPRLLLATIVPTDATLQAELFVPTRSVGFVRPGQTVRILYDAFPYQNFGTYSGQILQVSRSLSTAADTGGPVTLREPAYRVTASLSRPDVDAYGQRIPLQPDMLLRADIVLDSRPLLEWILNPLKGAGLRASQA